MTRLSHQDIDAITDDLESYNTQLVAATGYGLFEIACNCFGVHSATAFDKAGNVTIGVIPVTAGLGVISDFSNTVAGILQYLGFNVVVTSETDVTGLFRAVSSKVDGVFLADDSTFMALHGDSFSAVENSEVTGRMYGTVLDLMAKDSRQARALVVGCGPVGTSGARELVRRGRGVSLYDIDSKKAEDAHNTLMQSLEKDSVEYKGIEVVSDFKEAVTCHDLILEATPVAGVIRDTWLTTKKKIAMPGVPPGVSIEGAKLLGHRLIHDKLELGVAGMAVGLLALSGLKG